jgi:hypothetical protein
MIYTYVEGLYREPLFGHGNTFDRVTVLNPSDLLGKVKTCFSQKRYCRVID